MSDIYCSQCGQYHSSLTVCPNRYLHAVYTQKGTTNVDLDEAAQNTLREVYERKIAELEAELAEERAKNEPQAEASGEPVYIVIARGPGPDGDFVEVETIDGKSVGGIPWEHKADDLWYLGPLYRARPVPDATALQEALEQIADKLKDYPVLGGETCTCAMCTCLRIARAALLRSSPACVGCTERVEAAIGEPVAPCPRTRRRNDV